MSENQTKTAFQREMEKQQKGEKEVGNAMNTIEKKIKSCHIEKLDFKTVID